jgi:hypothetical protein
MRTCKSLGKLIKLRRTPPWPVLPSPDLPPREIADRLVEGYLGTSELIYRVLHLPSFRRDYEALWRSESSPDATFLVQLKLILAIGAVTYDDEFTLRPSAARWVYEGHAWSSAPDFKSRLSIRSMQTNILLVIAREITGTSAGMSWISAGSLVRMAIYMGYHRDPSRLPKNTLYAVEMRRRLWNTVLEIALASSMDSGGPPLLSLDDFDTEPPGNFNDEQLLTEGALTKPENEFTRISVARALRKTLPIRLAIAKYLNDIGSRCMYDEMLRLDTEFRVAYKSLRHDLQRSYPTDGPVPSSHELNFTDFIMSRYLSALHMPFIVPSLNETPYAYSRKVLLECALRIWWAVSPRESATASLKNSEPLSCTENYLRRVSICGCIFVNTIAMQACFVIATELKTQLREDESLGPVPLRPDLLTVLADGREWAKKRIRAGETNIKGYVFLSLVAAHVNCEMQGIAGSDLVQALVKATEDAEAECQSILEAMVAEGNSEGGVDLLTQMLNTPSDMMEDWDLMVCISIPFAAQKLWPSY